MIPVYCYDGSLFAIVGAERFGRLEAAGLIARIIRHRKGCINRAVLFGSPDDPSPPTPGTHAGTRYVEREKLESGRRCWRFRRSQIEQLHGGAG